MSFLILSYLDLGIHSILFISYVTDNGGDPNDATGDVAGRKLVTYIDDTRSMLKDLSMDDMEVGNSDAGYYFNDLVLEAVDYGVRDTMLLSLIYILTQDAAG